MLDLLGLLSLVLFVFIKPFVIQELRSCRPISPVHLHNPLNKFLVSLTHLALRRLLERRCLRLRNFLHEVLNRRYSLRARNFFILGWKRSEISELLFQDLQPVFFMAIGDGMRPKEVEISAVYRTYQLQSQAQGVSGTFSKIGCCLNLP